MSPVLMGVMLVFGAVAGTVGWRRATGAIYRVPLYRLELPPGMSRRDYERRRRRHRKFQRLFMTMFYSLVGAMGGVVVLMVLPRP
jgi:hypothetical protein